MHKPLNSFASDFARHSRLIQALNSAFLRLNCLFEFRQLQNTHYLSSSKHFTWFEAQNIDTPVYFTFQEEKNVFCALNTVTLIFRIVFLQKKDFCLNILKKNTFSLGSGRMKTIFAKKIFLLHIFLCFCFNSNKQKYIYST